MALWGKLDQANNSPKWAGALVNKPANSAIQTSMFGNTTSGAFVPGQVVGIFGADAAEVKAAGGKIAAPGWQKRTVGTGSAVSVAVTNAGADYANTDTWEVAVTGGVNVAGSLVTDNDGAIVDAVITNAGSGIATTSATATIDTVAGTGGVLTISVGGRAGRVQWETLACTDITSDASDDSILPDS